MLRQVALKRPSEKGYFYDVFWIEAELAKVGKAVVDEDRNVWVVAEVYGHRHAEEVRKWDGAARDMRDVLNDE